MTYIAGRPTASAVVATPVTAAVSSIAAPFHRDTVRAGHVGCFSTLRKEIFKLARSQAHFPKTTALDSQCLRMAVHNKNSYHDLRIRLKFYKGNGGALMF